MDEWYDEECRAARKKKEKKTKRKKKQKNKKTLRSYYVNFENH